MRDCDVCVAGPAVFVGQTGRSRSDRQIILSVKMKSPFIDGAVYMYTAYRITRRGGGPRDHAAVVGLGAERS